MQTFSLLLFLVVTLYTHICYGIFRFIQLFSNDIMEANTHWFSQSLSKYTICVCVSSFAIFVAWTLFSAAHCYCFCFDCVRISFLFAFLLTWFTTALFCRSCFTVAISSFYLYLFLSHGFSVSFFTYSFYVRLFHVLFLLRSLWSLFLSHCVCNSIFFLLSSFSSLSTKWKREKE